MTLDASFAHLAHDPRATLRRPPPGIQPERVRASANRWMLDHAGERCDVERIDLAATGGDHPLRLRLYRPDQTPGSSWTFFVHGGGFVYGSIETHDRIACRLAIESKRPVLSAEYRLGPEHPYPAALEDCRAALHWAVANARAIDLSDDYFALCGDSAGANLALTLALERSPRTPRGLLLFYPMLERTHDGRCREAANGPILSEDGLDWLWECYDPDHLSPALLQQDLSDLPPVSIVIAGFDVLRRDGERLASVLRRYGVQVSERLFAGLPHGFATMAADSPRVDEVLELAGGDLGQFLRLS